MGETELEDYYVKRVHSSIETLIVSGGKGALCCSKTLIDEKEVNYEVDKLAAIHIIKSGDAKRIGDLVKDPMQQAHSGQDLYPTSSDGAFELMFWRSGQYQALGQKQGHKSGHGGHNVGHGNGDCGNNSRNRIVSFLQQGESNRNNPVPGIDGTTIDA